MHPRKAATADLGPMLTTVTRVPGNCSLIRTASSTPWRSKTLTMDGTPSRIRVLVTGSIRISRLSGTCLTQTTTCKKAHPFQAGELTRGAPKEQECEHVHN